MSTDKVYYATGRRKSSAARVFLKPGSGKVIINERTPDVYFGLKTSILIMNEPFEVSKTSGKFDAYITVKGGGETGQAGAIRLGIARALCLDDDKNRPPLKKAGLLMRDSREVERKKYGKHKARKSTQFSKR